MFLPNKYIIMFFMTRGAVFWHELNSTIIMASNHLLLVMPSCQQSNSLRVRHCVMLWVCPQSAAKYNVMYYCYSMKHTNMLMLGWLYMYDA
jgi:hypothetical protein